MTQAELKAMAAHLVTNVAAFKRGSSGSGGSNSSGGFSFSAVERMVRRCRVIDVVRQVPGAEAAADAAGSGKAAAAAGGVVVPSGAVAIARRNSAGTEAATTAAGGDDLDCLYVRGAPDTVCTVVLTGELEVLAGSDAIRSLAGPWDVLGQGALTAPAGAYRPDFVARPASAVVRCLRISRDDYEQALADSSLFIDGIEAGGAALGNAWEGDEGSLGGGRKGGEDEHRGLLGAGSSSSAGSPHGHHAAGMGMAAAASIAESHSRVPPAPPLRLPAVQAPVGVVATLALPPVSPRTGAGRTSKTGAGAVPAAASALEAFGGHTVLDVSVGVPGPRSGSAGSTSHADSAAAAERHRLRQPPQPTHHRGSVGGGGGGGAN
jgi:hypothetical protein